MGMWCRGLTCDPVKVETAGSNPVIPATTIRCHSSSTRSNAGVVHFFGNRHVSTKAPTFVLLRSFLRHLLIVPIGLVLPFIAAQFSTDMRWSTADYVLAALLLSGVAVALSLRSVPSAPRWIRIAGMSAVVIMVLVWLEFAVGVFGTPWAGS